MLKGAKPFRLVPIRVGMILLADAYDHQRNACPHTRGDDPAKLLTELTETLLSPYAWG